jgi:hypothetical protein
VREEGRKSYYAIDFKRGEALSEKSLEFAVGKLKEIHAKCEEIDAARGGRKSSKKSTRPTRRWRSARKKSRVSSIRRTISIRATFHSSETVLTSHS